MGKLLRQGLEEENHTVVLATNGLDAVSAATLSSFDTIILDVMLPSLDGIQVARKLRKSGSQVPIIMLTARDAPADIVKGLDAGADDYLVKPFAFSVLVARLRAISRRSSQPPVASLQIDNLRIDPASHEVTRGDRHINLTATEYRLLEHLTRRAGRVASRPAIIEAVWGFDQEVELNTVDAYVKLLRDKIDAGESKRLIHTVRGYGYVLREP